VAKPRRLPSTRRAVPDTRLAEINQAAATTGNDPELDTLLLRLQAAGISLNLALNAGAGSSVPYRARFLGVSLIGREQTGGAVTSESDHPL
jgi:hypothetical protein